MRATLTDLTMYIKGVSWFDFAITVPFLRKTISDLTKLLLKPVRINVFVGAVY